MLDLLKVFAPDPAALHPDGQEPAPVYPDFDAARQHLRTAFADRAIAEEALQRAQAATARVRAVIDGVTPAEREAREAEAAASAVTKAWAMAGASMESSPVDQSALDRATEARRRAEQAQLMATGARAGLPSIVEAENDARNAVGWAEEAVKAAVRQVLIAQAAPRLAELAQLRPRYEALLRDVSALSLLLDPRWGAAHSWRQHVSGDGGEFKRQIAAFAIPLPAEDAFVADRAAELAAQAERIARDAEHE